MTRTWRLISLNALAAALLTTGPALPQTTDNPVTDSKKLDEIRKQLEEMRKEVVKSATSLAAIEQELHAARSDAVTRDKAAQLQIDALRAEMAHMQVELDALRKRPAPITREAGSPPTEPLPDANMGRVEMINTFPSEIGIRVNRRTYRIQPGETRLSEPIPAGDFTYEVLNVSEPRTRAVAANKVYTIYVHP